MPVIQLFGEIGRVAVNDGSPEIVLAGKIMIKRALGDADLLEDFVDSRTGEAFFGEDFNTAPH